MDPEDAHSQDAVNATSWTDQIATFLSKCTPKLHSELLGKAFMSYFVEWCQETREASCAFVADKTTWPFDDSLHKIRSVQPSVSLVCEFFLTKHHFLHTCVSHVCRFCFQDPVAEQHTRRVMKFLASTYRNNEAALKCQQAAGWCWTVSQHGPYREYVWIQPLVCGYEHLLHGRRISQAGRKAHWEVRGHQSGSSLNRKILERGLVQEAHDG